MKIKPWEHQEIGIQSIFNYFENNEQGNPIVATPCGTGKSVIIGGFLERTFNMWAGQKIMVLTHVKELIAQNYAKLINMWDTAPAGIHSASLNKRDIHNNILFAGIGSVVRRAKEFGHIDLIIVDECDLVSPSQATMYQRFLEDLKKVNPYIRVIGLTATPWRTKGGLLTNKGGLFTDICHDYTGVEKFNWFIDEGYLMPLIPPKTSFKFDTSGVSILGGEFNQRELQICVDQYELTRQAIEEVLDVAGDRKRWLVFCAGVEHSIHTAEILNEMGVSAGYVHSGNKDYPYTPKQRDDTLKAFDMGHYKAVTNNSVLSVGYDNTKIDLIVHLKPEKSSRTWVQELGRGTRPNFAPGFDLSHKQGRFDAIAEGGKENCLVMDFTDNTETLGTINAPLIPSGKKRKKNEKTEAPTKCCPNCNNWVHASAKECMHCGYEFPPSLLLINDIASRKELITKNTPEIVRYKVEHVSYSCHTKLSNKSRSLKVTYFTENSSFSEYVSLENSNVRRRSNIWWYARTSEKIPSTVHAALKITNRLKVPTSILVWVNKTYPEIVKHSFDESVVAFS